ncbi:hypothetical protein [Pseudogracilibacillus sp. SO30301A]|uniref:hypothetical protein n=1 Tax=Pseudogracilibacillus sp. SO30301A TaxID=3098291 RepID=UPI00300DFD4E
MIESVTGTMVEEEVATATGVDVVVAKEKEIDVESADEIKSLSADVGKKDSYN